MLKKLSFSIKFILGCLFLVLMTVTTMVTINFISLKASMIDMGKATTATVSDTFRQTINLADQSTLDKVTSDLVYMETELNAYGRVYQDKSTPVTMEITNQVTKEKTTETLPVLVAGAKDITNDFDIVDGIQETIGGTATIFHVLPGKLLRVSTNVLKLDGNRATGTYIPESSPVYKTVMKGETFRGKAFVVNDWYLTAYKPIKGASGKIEAVIYVGRKIMTPNLKKMLETVNIAGKGYAFVFNSKGEFQHHPNEKVREMNIRDFPFGEQLLNAQSDVVEYDWQGKRKYTSIFYFEPWDWYVAIGLDEAEMLHGMDTQLIRTSLISAAVAIAISILFAFIFARFTTAPIKAAVATAERITDGDLTARIAIKNQDEIGQLCIAFNKVMDRIGEIMDNNQGYVNLLNAVPDPIFAMDTNKKITVANEATLRVLGTDLGSLQGRRCDDIFNSDMCTMGESAMSDGGQSTSAISDAPFEITVNGKPTTFQSMGDVLRNSEGEVVGYLEVLTNITDMVEKEKELQRNLERINDVNAQINEAGVQLAANLDSVEDQITEVRHGADLQRQRTTETATAMEEMNATVMEVARNASDAAENANNAQIKAAEGVEVVTNAVHSISVVQEQVMALKERMTGLGSEAEAIGQIIGVINDIADQTNLLALNAAIEAARAGDAGRGFAVVADEVRKLAEKTMTATTEVESAISSIQNGTREAIGATEKAAEDILESTEMANQSGQRLNEIQQLVMTTTEQVQSIATAAEEQSAASEEINMSIEEVSRISSETADGMSSASQAVEELTSLAMRLKELAS